MDLRKTIQQLATHLFIASTILPTTASAQADPLSGQNFNWISVSAATTSPGLNQSLSMGRVQGSYRVADLISFRFDIPFSDPGQGFPFDGQNLGNVYAGVLLESSRSHVFSEFGIRFPTAGSSASDPLAFRAVAPEFGEAFLDNVTSVSGNVNYVAEGAKGFFIKIRTGIAAWFDDLGRVGSETLFNYSAEGGVAKNGFRADARIQGRAIVSGGTGSLADRTFHQFRLSASRNAGTFTPIATLTIPLGEFNDGVEYVFGLGIAMRFGQQNEATR